MSLLSEQLTELKNSPGSFHGLSYKPSTYKVTLSLTLHLPSFIHSFPFNRQIVISGLSPPTFTHMYSVSPLTHIKVQNPAQPLLPTKDPPFFQTKKKTGNLEVISEKNGEIPHERVYDFTTFGAPCAHVHKFRTNLRTLTRR